MAKARQALGDATFYSHQLTGSTLSYEEAISQARSWLESQP